MKTPVAFKEWAVIVDLIGRGDQILILRKGGIHEDRGGFQVEHRGFFLFPTLFHQQRESVLPFAQSRFDEISTEFSDPGTVNIQFWVDVVETHWLNVWNKVEKLQPCHPWTDKVIRDRFGWVEDEGIFAIAVRASRLAEPKPIPLLKEYGGCKSWVEIALPPVEVKAPVLSEHDFETKLKKVQACLA